MAEITEALLHTIAPSGKRLPELASATTLLLPQYKIDDALEIRGFLATACFESDYFKTLHEYGSGKGRAYGKPDKITKQIYYGRGIFQNTWKTAYVNFTKYVSDNWDWIRGLLNLANDVTAPDFVNDPNLLATPFWAVFAACWYWQVNHLSKWAEKGEAGFFGLQGLVNRGSASKRALDYDNRLAVYHTLIKHIPDDFSFTISAPLAQPHISPPAATDSMESTTTLDDTASGSPQAGQTVQNADTIVNTSDVNATPTETKEMTAPPKDGSTAAATQMTIAGIAIPALLVPVIKSIQDLVSNGYIDAKELGTTCLSFVQSNFKWVLMLLAVVIAFLALKKFYKQITFWLEMYFTARKDMHDIKVVQSDKQGG